jgi:hypothetical protein
LKVAFCRRFLTGKPEKKGILDKEGFRKAREPDGLVEKENRTRLAGTMEINYVSPIGRAKR